MDKIKYKIEFSNGETITSYLACAYVEEFCEGEDSSDLDKLYALSFLCGTGIYKSLQGFYGRSIHNLIADGIITDKGEITEYGLSIID